MWKLFLVKPLYIMVTECFHNVFYRGYKKNMRHNLKCNLKCNFFSTLQNLYFVMPELNSIFIIEKKRFVY